MAYYNDGKTFRNLPEQVDKNKTDIEEMQSTVETDEKNINDNMNKILAHDTRINALETTKLSATDNSIKLTRSNAEMGSVSIAKVGGNTLVNGNDIPLATINGESIMQNKDFTIDSNLSNLLWANLGIGRWANQTLYYILDNPKIEDGLIAKYTDLSRYIANVKFAYQDNAETIYSNTITLDCGDTSLSNYRRGCAFALGFKNPKLKVCNVFFAYAYYAFAFTDLVRLEFDNVAFSKLWMENVLFYTFAYSSKLEYIGECNVSGVQCFADVFKGCSNLKHIGFKHINKSIDISPSTAFEEADLVEIISNLDPVSTTQTLIMGATNLAKLSSSDILIATGKGWQLA